MMRTFLILFTSLTLALNSHAGFRKKTPTMSKWTDKYDGYFKKYSKRYFGPQFNWRWFKAQGIAESNLESAVKSHVGAVGIMQIMPATFGDIRKRNPHFSHLESPKWNIAAGVYYDRVLYRKIRKPIASQAKLLFTFASYNAGYSRILRAFKSTETLDWPNVKSELPGETRLYVKKSIGLMDTPKKQL